MHIFERKDCKFTFFFTKITSQLQISIKNNYIQKYALHLEKDLKSTKYYSTKQIFKFRKMPFKLFTSRIFLDSAKQILDKQSSVSSGWRNDRTKKWSIFQPRFQNCCNSIWAQWSGYFSTMLCLREIDNTWLSHQKKFPKWPCYS
jgi:hypothetical protein